MIRNEWLVRDCDKEIKAHGSQTLGDKVHPAVVARNRHQAMIISQQRALRLCPSQRMRQDAAALNNTRARKPPHAK